jgi:hypothetical protein
LDEKVESKVDEEEQADEEDPKKSVEHLVDFELLPSILVQEVAKDDADGPRSDSQMWSKVEFCDPNVPVTFRINSEEDTYQFMLRFSNVFTHRSSK